MSITPHDPESAAGSAGGSDAGESEGRLRRLARRLRGVLVRVLTWVVTSRVAHDDGDDEEPRRTTVEGGDDTSIRRGWIARLGVGRTGSRADTDRDPDSSTEPPAELPSRPTLRAEERAESLRLSRPGETDAYVESDHWEDVEP